MAASNAKLIAGTHRRVWIVAFVNEYYAEQGYPPTLREIAEGVGLTSASTALVHCETLVRSGGLVRAGTRERSYYPRNWRRA